MILFSDYLNGQLSNIDYKIQKFKIINSRWECHNCGDDRNAHYIFNIVRRSIYRESREVYLNFDHSWLDIVLDQESKVIVQNVNRELLSEYVLPDYLEPPANLTSDRSVKETYYFIISLPSDTQSDIPLPYRDALKIDKFLTNNPCWIPLKDPPVRIYTADYPIQLDVPDNSQLPTCDNHPEIANRTAPHIFAMNNSELTHLYKYSVVLARLPAMNFHATCAFYTKITRHQFRQHCPTPAENASVAVYHLGSIGWSHCVRYFLGRKLK